MKARLNLNVDTELLKACKDKGLNLSKYFETCVRNNLDPGGVIDMLSEEERLKDRMSRFKCHYCDNQAGYKKLYLIIKDEHIIPCCYKCLFNGSQQYKIWVREKLEMADVKIERRFFLQYPTVATMLHDIDDVRIIHSLQFIEAALNTPP